LDLKKKRKQENSKNKRKEHRSGPQTTKSAHMTNFRAAQLGYGADKWALPVGLPRACAPLCYTDVRAPLISRLMPGRGARDSLSCGPAWSACVPNARGDLAQPFPVTRATCYAVRWAPHARIASFLGWSLRPPREKNGSGPCDRGIKTFWVPGRATLASAVNTKSQRHLELRGEPAPPL
jgi:hypothetical protein